MDSNSEIQEYNVYPMLYFRRKFSSSIERVQKGIAHWDKQNDDVPAPNCVLKV